MKLWPLYTVLLLVQQSVLLGQGVATLSRRGEDALAAGLWEIAELRFKDCLADPSLNAEEKSKAALRLVEAMIRGGNPAEALDWLGQSWVAKTPETLFWKAQALAGQHRLSEALAVFSELLANPTAPYRREAGLTRAGLQLSLGQPEAALESLDRLLLESPDSGLAKVQLYQVEILLDLQRVVDARRAMPLKESVAAEDLPLAALLEAQLLLREGRTADAEAAFQVLVNHPQGQSIRHFHAAEIGLADSIQARGQTDVAVNSLLTFLQDHPDSPLLESIFRRLLAWLPEKPSASDPILDRTAGWILPPVAVPIGLIATTSSESGAVAAWPSRSNSNELSKLHLFSLYTRAVGLYRMATPDSRVEALRLFKRLRLEYPDHTLAIRSLYQQARWLLDAGSVDQAFTILDMLRSSSQSPQLRGEAAFIEARVASTNGDPKKAIQLFDEAAAMLAGPESRAAKLQAAIARLRSGEFQTVKLIQPNGQKFNQELEADIELEQALATTAPAAAKQALKEFFSRFPDHPRAPEARLAAAEAALSDATPDLEFAHSQLELLAGSPERSAGLSAARIALAKLRIADLSNDPTQTISVAQSIIGSFPESPAAAEAELTLGRNLFQTGSYNAARLVLGKLAASETNPARSQTAWLLAARAAALGATPQSKEEALVLFDKAISAKGPVSSLAILEKARHLIDLYRLEEASAFLRKWTVTIAENDPLQLPAGLLLAEALYAQGSTRAESLVEALAVYDKLLVQAAKQPALLNRLQYLRGSTLEQLPDEKDPTQKRDKQAFQAYHSVLETATRPAEWEYFERCGFRALALLEKSERWPVAISLAKKIASFNGPRADEAAARASQLQLKHMIWED